ncbi:hypothetical protein TNCV_2279501 [Trichonephila clavipes]|uniref:Uncharacterized protein n=1 Tax=Trichonephila clavipes TaxID=2585209 RepID=A0A8X6RFC9_TRICX|nr:hypothetical protein TNCV_2279501 [Trichonephila clavipes]
MVNQWHNILDMPVIKMATIVLLSNSETWSKDARCLQRGKGKQLTHNKNAVFQIANLFSPYIALASGSTVARDVRLLYNANDLRISSSSTHDVNFAWFPCILLGAVFCVASSISPYFFKKVTKRCLKDILRQIAAVHPCNKITSYQNCGNEMH